MGTRSRHLVRSTTPEITDVFGSCTTDGSGDPGTHTGIGTLTRTGTGTYRITLDIDMPALRFPDVKLLRATAADFQTQITAIDLTNKRVDFTVLTGATAANFTSGTIYWRLAVKSTGQSAG